MESSLLNDMLEIVSNIIDIIFSNLQWFTPSILAEENKYVFGIDMSIESLRSREFSIYIFVFLIMS